jgi:NAD(P)-dependent dehydrogenase (short-subunit alcohol dehydrogenase family)
MDEYGRLDGVVHVAGILRDRMIFNMSEQEWDDVVAVHLTGFFNVAKPASMIMRQQRYGRIIGFSSSSGMNGNTGQANYGAAKAGITGGVRCAARDMGRYGVTSNGDLPGRQHPHDAVRPGSRARPAGARRHPGRPAPGVDRQPAPRREVRCADDQLPAHRPGLEHQRQDLLRLRRQRLAGDETAVPHHREARHVGGRRAPRPGAEPADGRRTPTQPRRRPTWTSRAARSRRPRRKPQPQRSAEQQKGRPSGRPFCMSASASLHQW